MCMEFSLELAFDELWLAKNTDEWMYLILLALSLFDLKHFCAGSLLLWPSLVEAYFFISKPTGLLNLERAVCGNGRGEMRTNPNWEESYVSIINSYINPSH